MKKMASLLLAGAMAVTGTVQAFASEPIYLDIEKKVPTINYFSNVVYTQYYKSNEVVQMKMDILAPATKEKCPLIVYVEGGGFYQQNRDKRLQMRMALAEAGYVVATVQHRLVPQYTFPSSVLDIKAGIRYLKAHADQFNIDKERVGVWGCSAGGYMAEMIGVTNGEEQFDKGDWLEENSDVQAAVSFFGISDLSCIGEGLGEDIENLHKSPATTEAMMVNGMAFRDPGAGVLETPEKTAAASPISHVDANDVPFLLIHGTNDTLVSKMQSIHFHEKLQETGVPSTLYLINGAGHGTEEFHQPEVLQLVIDFFDGILKK